MVKANCSLMPKRGVVHADLGLHSARAVPARAILVEAGRDVRGFELERLRANGLPIDVDVRPPE